MNAVARITKNAPHAAPGYGLAYYDRSGSGKPKFRGASAATEGELVEVARSFGATHVVFGLGDISTATPM